MANLLVLKGTNPGATLPLAGDKIVLGRNADCGIVINMPAVSREHALIRKIDGNFYIEDLKSRNFTFVNNQKIATRTLLRHNDRIKICESEFLYVDKAQLPPEMRREAETDADEEETC